MTKKLKKWDCWEGPTTGKIWCKKCQKVKEVTIYRNVAKCFDCGSKIKL